ncbi:MAG: ABC transporter permease, partial [Candidatus Bathyarchaeota archaeon]|nr:ABC transporter permease [Candidatus Bathyarchaeota archaeon]
MSEEVQYSKSKLHGLWALTNRELKKWYQQPFVFAMGIIQPILWLALLGKAMNIGNIIPTGIPGLDPKVVMMHTFGTADYFSFMSMSMVAFTVVFTTAFVGMSVVWDKRLGFMNKVLSTPVSRSVIILSKVLAASVRAIFQAAIVAAIAFALGLQTGTNFSAWSIFGVFAIVFLISVGLASFFTALTLRATRMEMPQAIFQLITLPLMFASSAYFPIAQMPSWLQAIANVNPISYTIDAVRRLMVFTDGL